jgi:CHAD domain-containing protein
MRVSLRRLRVGLKFFSSLFPAGELKQVQRQLRRITRHLGELREFDVMCNSCANCTDGFSPWRGSRVWRWSIHC